MSWRPKCWSACKYVYIINVMLLILTFCQLVTSFKAGSCRISFLCLHIHLNICDVMKTGYEWYYAVMQYSVIIELESKFQARQAA